MMNRLTGFLMCAVPALLMLVCGLLVPAHLRAVDACVLQEAGRNTTGLIEQGLSLVEQDNLGAAQLLLQAAQAQGLPDRQGLGLAITNLALQHPRWLVWGGGDARLERLFASDPHLPKSGSEPFTDFVVREENRTVVLELLRASPRAGGPGAAALPRADQHRHLLPVAVRLRPGPRHGAGGLRTSCWNAGT